MSFCLLRTFIAKTFFSSSLPAPSLSSDLRTKNTLLKLPLPSTSIGVKSCSETEERLLVSAELWEARFTAKVGVTSLGEVFGEKEDGEDDESACQDCPAGTACEEEGMSTPSPCEAGTSRMHLERSVGCWIAICSY